MSDWHGKHPIPYDFFNSFNHASKKNLDWFWQKWFFDWVYPDLGIKQVQQQNGNTKIIITNKGGLPVPVYITITAGQGQTKIIHFGADVWAGGKKEFTVLQKYPFKINAVKLGNDFTPDKNKEDNNWESR